MLVVIDVGNTNITLGVYDQDELIANFIFNYMLIINFVF